MQIDANPEQKTQLVWTEGTYACGTTQPPRKTGEPVKMTQCVVTLEENRAPPCPSIDFHSPAVGDILIPQIPTRPEWNCGKNNKRGRNKTFFFPDSDPYLSSLLQARYMVAIKLPHVQRVTCERAQGWVMVSLSDSHGEALEVMNMLPMKGAELISV